MREWFAVAVAVFGLFLSTSGAVAGGGDERLEATTRKEPHRPMLHSLADSLEPLTSRFNADKDKPRLVVLLSPT